MEDNSPAGSRTNTPTPTSSPVAAPVETLSGPTTSTTITGNSPSTSTTVSGNSPKSTIRLVAGGSSLENPTLLSELGGNEGAQEQSLRNPEAQSSSHDYLANLPPGTSGVRQEEGSPPDTHTEGPSPEINIETVSTSPSESTTSSLPLLIPVALLNLPSPYANGDQNGLMSGTETVSHPPSRNENHSDTDTANYSDAPTAAVSDTEHRFETPVQGMQSSLIRAKHSSSSSGGSSGGKRTVSFDAVGTDASSVLTLSTLSPPSPSNDGKHHNRKLSEENKNDSFHCDTSAVDSRFTLSKLLVGESSQSDDPFGDDVAADVPLTCSTPDQNQFVSQRVFILESDDEDQVIPPSPFDSSKVTETSGGSKTIEENLSAVYVEDSGSPSSKIIIESPIRKVIVESPPIGIIPESPVDDVPASLSSEIIGNSQDGPASNNQNDAGSEVVHVLPESPRTGVVCDSEYICLSSGESESQNKEASSVEQFGQSMGEPDLRGGFADTTVTDNSLAESVKRLASNILATGDLLLCPVPVQTSSSSCQLTQEDDSIQNVTLKSRTIVLSSDETSVDTQEQIYNEQSLTDREPPCVPRDNIVPSNSTPVEINTTSFPATSASNSTADPSLPSQAIIDTRSNLIGCTVPSEGESILAQPLASISEQVTESEDGKVETIADGLSRTLQNDGVTDPVLLMISGAEKSAKHPVNSGGSAATESKVEEVKIIDSGSVEPMSPVINIPCLPLRKVPDPGPTGDTAELTVNRDSGRQQCLAVVPVQQQPVDPFAALRLPDLNFQQVMQALPGPSGFVRQSRASYGDSDSDGDFAMRVEEPWRPSSQTTTEESYFSVKGKGRGKRSKPSVEIEESAAASVANEGAEEGAKKSSPSATYDKNYATKLCSLRVIEASSDDAVQNVTNVAGVNRDKSESGSPKAAVKSGTPTSTDSAPFDIIEVSDVEKDSDFVLGQILHGVCEGRTNNQADKILKNSHAGNKTDKSVQVDAGSSHDESNRQMFPVESASGASKSQESSPATGKGKSKSTVPTSLNRSSSDVPVSHQMLVKTKPFAKEAPEADCGLGKSTAKHSLMQVPTSLVVERLSKPGSHHASLGEPSTSDVSPMRKEQSNPQTKVTRKVITTVITMRTIEEVISDGDSIIKQTTKHFEDPPVVSTEETELPFHSVNLTEETEIEEPTSPVFEFSQCREENSTPTAKKLSRKRLKMTSSSTPVRNVGRKKRKSSPDENPTTSLAETDTQSDLTDEDGSLLSTAVLKSYPLRKRGKSVSVSDKRSKDDCDADNDYDADVSTIRNRESTASFHRDINIGMRVMARWQDGYYYPGLVIDQDSTGRWIVKYDDGNVRPAVGGIIAVDKLPVGASVFAMSKDKSYFEAGMIIGHKYSNDSTTYIVEFDSNNIKEIHHSAVTMTSDQVSCLLSGSQRPMDSGSKISLDNIVEGKRKSKPPGSNPSSPLYSVKTPPSRRHRVIEKAEMYDDMKSPSRKRTRPSSTVSAVDKTPPQKKSRTSDESGVDLIEKATDNTDTPKSRRSAQKNRDQPSTSKSSSRSLQRVSSTETTYGPMPPRGSQLFIRMKFLMTGVDVTCKSSLYSSPNEGDGHGCKFNKQYLTNQILAAGGTIIEDVEKSEFLSDSSEYYLLSRQYTRTGKYFKSLSLGIPCVSYVWIIECCRQNKRLKHQAYLLPTGWSLLTDEDIEWHGKTNILKGQNFVLTLSEKPAGEFWSSVLNMAGAKLLPESAVKDSDSSNSSIVNAVISDEKCSSIIIRHCTLKKIHRIPVEWIIQCLIHGRQLQFTAHEQLML